MPPTVSDDLRIPMPAARAPISSGYRPRPGGEDAGMRMLTIAAGALGGALLLGMGGWAVLGRKPAVIPVIEADTRPLRIKPENPGGMQISGDEQEVLGGQATGTERMAPTAEAPAPQALRAQMQQAAPAAPTPSATPPVAALSPPAPLAPGVSPLPDTPTRPGPAARAPAPAATATPKPATPAAGTPMVQLAALESDAAAQAEWSRLAKRMPELFGTRKLVVQKAEHDGHPVWRVRTGGFADMAEATGFCGKVKAKGGTCTLATF